MSVEELEHEVDAQIELQEDFGSDDDLDDIICEFEAADDDVGNDDDVPSDTEVPSNSLATSTEPGIATKTKLPMKVDWDKLAIVQFHVDCEHGGEQCGLIQLSGVAYDPYTDSILGDDGTMNEPGSSKFNMYINPGPLAIWNIAGCAASHKLTAQSVEIIDAGGLEVVWPKFVAWQESHLAMGAKRGELVAWGGGSCDVEWFFKITEVRGFAAARWCPYFWDPVRTIKHYTTCPLHIPERELLIGARGYGLGSMWCHHFEQTVLPNAHDSLAWGEGVRCRVRHKQLPVRLRILHGAARDLQRPDGGCAHAAGELRSRTVGAWAGAVHG